MAVRQPRAVPGLSAAPEGTTELGIDIIEVDRIRDALARFGERFVGRVLTPAEAAYVRGRPETMAGRWAAKEAVSKVLGLGVRGIGWRDIEIERLPTGQPAVRLHGRAAAGPSSSGWAGSPSRSATSGRTPSPSPSASARPAARTSSRPTSRRASTSASGASRPAWRPCARSRSEDDRRG